MRFSAIWKFVCNAFLRLFKTESKIQSRRMSRRFSQAIDGIYKNLKTSNLIGDKELRIIKNKPCAERISGKRCKSSLSWLRSGWKWTVIVVELNGTIRWNWTAFHLIWSVNFHSLTSPTTHDRPLWTLPRNYLFISLKKVLGEGQNWRNIMAMNTGRRLRSHA